MASREAMMKIKLYAEIFLILLTVTACGLRPNAPVGLPASPTAPSAPVPVQRDIPYCVMDGVELKMDLYTSGDSVKKPAVIFVHGGSWVEDNKSTSIGKEVLTLTQAGLVIFSIDYRLGGEHKFPAMIEDVKCAVRSIRAHAQEYNIDPDHIGAYGGSAGGHLVALLGTADESAGFDVGEYLEYSSRVQAVVDAFGPTDLIAQYQLNTIPPMKDVFLESDLERAGPIRYVSPDDPPFLILHGALDRIVPLEQSQTLYDLLLANNIPAELIIVENGLHGFGASNREKPTRDELSQIIADFFVEMLR